MTDRTYYMPMPVIHFRRYVRESKIDYEKQRDRQNPRGFRSCTGLFRGDIQPTSSGVYHSSSIMQDIPGSGWTTRKRDGRQNGVRLGIPSVASSVSTQMRRTSSRPSRMET